MEAKARTGLQVSRHADSGMYSWHEKDSATRQSAMAFRSILPFSAFGVRRVIVIRFEQWVCLFAVRVAAVRISFAPLQVVD